MKVTEEMVQKAEKALADMTWIQILADESLTAIFLSCRLYRMEQEESSPSD